MTPEETEQAIETTPVSDLTISIDRQCKSWAVFNERFECLCGFMPFSNERFALEDAKEWCRKHGCIHPQILYPKIKSIRMS